MDTIRDYKALAIVSNVRQGEMIKELIQKNKELERLKEITEKCVPGMIQIYGFVKEQQNMQCDEPPNGVDDGSGDYDDYLYIQNLLIPLEKLLNTVDSVQKWKLSESLSRWHPVSD